MTAHGCYGGDRGASGSGRAAPRSPAARSWHADHDTVDLVADLRITARLRPPPSAPPVLESPSRRRRPPTSPLSWPSRPPRSLAGPAGSGPATGTSCSPGTARERSSPPCWPTAPTRTPPSGRCSDRQPPPSDASESRPIWKDAASAPPWLHARRRYCTTAAPAPVTSAGRSANLFLARVNSVQYSPAVDNSVLLLPQHNSILPSLDVAGFLPARCKGHQNHALGPALSSRPGARRG